MFWVACFLDSAIISSVFQGEADACIFFFFFFETHVALKHDLVIFCRCVIISIPLFCFDTERLESDTEIGSFL